MNLRSRFLFLLFCCGLSTADAQNQIHQLDSLFNRLYEKERFNGNVLIADKGHVIYQKSFGNANEQTGEKLNDSTVFSLASVSKQFTAMAIAILQERGKLQYDDSLYKYFPSLPQYGRVTIRQLLWHTGGLPDFIAIADSHWNRTKIMNNEDLIGFLDTHKVGLAFVPGSRHDYSNTGYALLACVVEKLSGSSYADFLRQNIFEPLGMTHTSVYRSRYKPRKTDNYAYGYIYDKATGKQVLPDDLPITRRVYYLDGVYGQSGISSSAPDLLIWDRALRGNKLVSANTTALMYTSGLLPDGSNIHYGFGLMLHTDTVVGRIAAHTGGWPGYVTLLEQHADSDKTVIILQNHYSYAVLPYKAIRKILYGQPLNVPRVAISLPQQALMPLVGNYSLGKDVVVKVFTQADTLKIQVTGQQAYTALPESPRRFFCRAPDVLMEFKPDTGKAERLYISQDDAKTEAARID